MGDKQPDKLTMMDGVGFSTTNDENFGFMFKDTINQSPFFDTTKRSLIYTDKYLEMGFTVPTQTLFGLGQHNAKFLLSEGEWTMFNRDQPGSPVAEGKGNEHLYGTHPFLMMKTNDNRFAGVLFYNSNPQQVSIRFTTSGKSLITYKTIGGILDVYYIMPNTADEVIRKYNELVGKPSLPPFWALGFHQCSWQYNTTSDLKEVVETYQSKGYLFDTIWSDIMYMDRYIDFTVDTTNFSGIRDYVQSLHDQNLHFVPIVDAGISIEAPVTGTNWYQEGDKQGVFIKSTKNPENKFGGNLIGQVWPGFTAFVDFFHPNADKYWSSGLAALHDLILFDGLWLDMNEPSNFCEDKNQKSIGECYPEETHPSESSQTHTARSLSESPVKPGEFDDIPFTPGNHDLFYKTLSMDAYHYDADENGTFVMYNIHNLYGTLETKATSNYLKSKDSKRQLIISRDSFVGHGQYGSIWTGDNDASQEHMQLSINQIMNFNMFGMPFVGGDICGFGGPTTTPELCARWAQVGAFYPFMRNHYAIGKGRQEFYTFDEKYQKGMKEVIRQRYALLRYMYTCLYKSSKFGDPMIRHLMYEWPGVDALVKDENSFMIGPAIRVTANFDISMTPLDFQAAFAKGRYLELYNYTITEVKKDGDTVKLYNGWDYANVHLVEGNIIPIQDSSVESGVTRSNDLVGQQMKLLVFPNAAGYAKGNMFVASGETTDEKEQYFTLIHANKAIQVVFTDGIPDEGADYNEVIEEIHIVGTDNSDAVDFACYMDKNQQIKPLSIETATSPDGKNKFIRIFGGSNAVQFDHVDTIFYGANGADYNHCDKGYKSFKKQSSATKLEYSLTKGMAASNDDGLKLTLQLMGDSTIRMTITDGTDRFIVPGEALNPNSFQSSYVKDDVDIKDFVKISDDSEKFSIKIHEYQNEDSVYFRIDEDSLTFSKYFLSLETQVNTNQKMYGFGERVTDFFVQPGIYTSWAKDQTDPVDDGKRPGKNIYGTHPVYFTQSTTGKKNHWGMFNLNANAQDTKIEFNGDLGAKISHYISGTGIFDMFFFLENTMPETTVSKYHDIIGSTLLPPFWSMGWHQCKYGYDSTKYLQSVFDNYELRDFPMDVLWSDIDHMLKYRDFTYDSNGTYAGLPEFIENTLHKNNRFYVPIIDAGVAIVRDGSYKVFEDGRKKGVFIKSGNTQRTKGNDMIQDMNGILYGKVWPGFAAFPDFTREVTNEWWIQSLKDFHAQVGFDGVWLDMNEASNFCTGPCIPEDVVAPESSVKSKLVYMPGGGDIEEKSLSIDGVHEKGLELDYHSLFGFLQGVATSKYFTQDNKRQFIISRSTFAGQGKYTSHWNGDNFSRFSYLKLSVTGIMNMNLYGINFNGADICGFLEETTPELCQKWTNVGAFYPFARNHDDIGNSGQEPYTFSEDIQDTMRNAIRWRYALLRYYYTQLYINSVHGGMFWKPLFFEFPEEPKAYNDIEKNIMIGSAIKLSAMLDEGDIKTESFVFPAGVWCNIIDYSCVKTTKTIDQNLNVEPQTLNIHLRMGSIIPLQRNAVTNKVKNTHDLNALPMGIMINMDTDTKTAKGQFFADDGVSYQSNLQTYLVLDFISLGNTATLSSTAVKSGFSTEAYTKLNLIEIVGAKNAGLNTLLKMSIDGGDTIVGTYDSNKDLLSFSLEEGIDMTKFTKIDFTN